MSSRNAGLTTPPHNIEAEEALLGSILIDPAMLNEITLPAAAFYITRHGWIWQVYQDLRANGSAIDLLTVQEELDRRKQLAETGGRSYLTRLVTLAVVSFNAATYAALVHEEYERRLLIASASEIAKQAYDHGTPIETVKTNSVKAVHAATMEGGLSNTLLPIANAAADLIDDVMDASLGKYLLRTGLEPLDANMRLDIDTLTMLAGRPGMSKTSLLLQIADLVSEQKLLVTFFSKEMSLRQCLIRLACRRAKVSPQELRMGRVSYDERKLVADWLAEFTNRRTLYIDARKAQTTNEVRAELHKLTRREGQVALVLADHLRLFTNRPELPEHLRLGDISRDFKVIAGEFQTRVVSAVQLNRAIEGRPDDERRPTMADIRGSGQIEEDADNILGLYRLDYYEKTGVDKTVEILNLKFRDGDVNATTFMNFEGAYMGFERKIQ
jgi:replicative DNA helicase